MLAKRAHVTGSSQIGCWAQQFNDMHCHGEVSLPVQNGTGPNGNSPGSKGSRSNPEQMDTLSTPVLAGNARTHGAADL